MAKINIFNVLIDENFSVFNTNTTLTPTNNKKILSLINDFEGGDWRYEKFQNFIWDNIVETALSAKEREKLIEQPFSSLKEAARNLRLINRSDKGEGSEIAEILLYGIMKHHYGALPVVPKIFHKQNPNDNAKGVDSVHIVIKNNDFSIWFGEAKFYNDIKDARLNKIIESIENSLGEKSLKKENAIITNLPDIDIVVKEKELNKHIKSLLSDSTSIDELKPKLHIPILLLYECAITKEARELSSDYEERIKSYHKERAQSYFSKQISKIGSIWKYSEINFHLIIFPVPDKNKIVDKFKSKSKIFRDQ